MNDPALDRCPCLFQSMVTRGFGLHDTDPMKSRRKAVVKGRLLLSAVRSPPKSVCFQWSLVMYYTCDFEKWTTHWHGQSHICIIFCVFITIYPSQ